MNASPRCRVVLVGCGDIAETGHVPALLEHPRFELACLCDIRPARAELLSEQAGGVPACTSHRELLDRPDVDAAVLALHPEVSADVAVDFLRSGKPVLDEKPLATTLKAGRRLVRTLEATRGVYQIGFAFRHCPFVSQVAEFARRIGTPATFHVTIFDERLDRGDRDHFARIQRILASSSAVTHEGSHVLDYFAQWNGSGLVDVHRFAARTTPDFAGPNLWSAQFRAADGSVLRLEIGWLLPELPRLTLGITGPHGFLRVDLCEGTGMFGYGGDTERVRVHPLVQNWAGQLDTFAAAIGRAEAWTCTMTDGLRALAATVACEQSQRTGGAVEIEPVASGSGLGRARIPCFPG